MAFAATAATIVAGAVAERMRFRAYAVYTVFLTALIYPIIVHWTWGGGWLSELGYSDFAGSGIVHMTGGVAAAVGAAILGPRLGKYGPDGKPRAIPGHSIPFVVIGAFILFIGWFGFNPGSVLVADGPAVGVAALSTALAGGAGAIAACGYTWIRNGKPDTSMAANGLLAGLVAITAGPDVITNWWAILVGFLGGVIVCLAVPFFDKIKIDDPVGAASVHGVVGAFGVLAVGIFGADVGLLRGGGVEQLWYQFVGVVAIAAFVGVTMAIIFLGIKATVGLRVSEQEEIEGLDVWEHGAAGYADDISYAGVDERLGGLHRDDWLRGRNHANAHHRHHPAPRPRRRQDGAQGQGGHGHHHHRGPWIRTPGGSHRDLPRRRVHRGLPAEAEAGGRRGPN